METIDPNIKQRICKKCKVNKSLEENFHFHKPTGYYNRTCRECVNKENRLKRPVNIGRREDSLFVRQKICNHCKIAKDLNLKNFAKQQGRFSKICKDCRDEYLNTRSKYRRKGHLPDDSIKICMSCNLEKPVTQFLFTKRGDYYSYCRQCTASKAKERRSKFSKDRKQKIKIEGKIRQKENKANYILRAYKNCDFGKDLENNLTKEFIELNLSKPCFYCSYPSTGLDRKDNNLGHTIENTVPCCKECNIARNRLFSFEEMQWLGERIKEIKDKRLISKEFPEIDTKYGLYIAGVDPYRQNQNN